MKPIGLLFKSYPELHQWIVRNKYQFDSLTQSTMSAYKGEQEYHLMHAATVEDAYKYIGCEFQDIIGLEANPEVYKFLSIRIRP